MNERRLIVGASARAAAFSAKRAGFDPVVVDCFADEDLQTLCPTIQITDYPNGFLTATRDLPPTPWLYTGGLENYPEIVDQIATRHPLLGTPGSVLKRIRDPRLLRQTLIAAGFRSPEILDAGSSEKFPTARWLEKPLRSGGGIGVRLLAQPRLKPGSYVQQLIDGTPVGVLLEAVEGRAKWLGATRQLIGCDWAGTDGFHYAGSVGPLTLDPHVRDEMIAIGDCLVREFGLIGVFGVDAILSASEVWTIEVNPRYTASFEVLERAACAPCCGKAVVYATNDLMIDESFASFVRQQNGDPAWPTIADIPRVGTPVNRRQPLVSVFASGATERSVLERLQQLAQRVLQIVRPNDQADCALSTKGAQLDSPGRSPGYSNE